MDRQELFEDFQRALIQLAEALELPADIRGKMKLLGDVFESCPEIP
jgi:hypothetical protein